jgi:hypothetical protein
MNSAAPQDAIQFAVDHNANTIFSTARGMISCEEIVTHIQAKTRAGLIQYAELFDARDIVLDLSVGDLPAIASEMRGATAGETPGKIAVVTNSAFIYGLAGSYAAMTKDDNPHFEVFNDIEEARSWILNGSVLQHDGAGFGSSRFKDTTAGP